MGLGRPGTKDLSPVAQERRRSRLLACSYLLLLGRNGSLMSVPRALCGLATSWRIARCEPVYGSDRVVRQPRSHLLGRYKVQ